MILAAAGYFYFALVFAAGIAFGAVRTLWLTPAVGAPAATLIELPVILAVSWVACLFVLRRVKVKARVGEQLAAMAAPAGLIGLAGQILFAAFPLLALTARR